MLAHNMHVIIVQTLLEETRCDLRAVMLQTVLDTFRGGLKRLAAKVVVDNPGIGGRA